MNDSDIVEQAWSFCPPKLAQQHSMQEAAKGGSGSESCSRPWRSTAFWHSDVEDAVDRTVCDADHYSPESRADFLRAVVDVLNETASKLEAENAHAQQPATGPRSDTHTNHKST